MNFTPRPFIKELWEDDLCEDDVLGVEDLIWLEDFLREEDFLWDDDVGFELDELQMYQQEDVHEDFLVLLLFFGLALLLVLVEDEALGVQLLVTGMQLNLVVLLLFLVLLDLTWLLLFLVLLEFT